MIASIMLEISILFVLLSIAPLGYYISQSVQDEVPKARKYVELGIDALFVIMCGITIWSFGLHITAIIAPIAIILAKRLWSLRRIYAPVSGAIIAVSSLTNMYVTLVIMCLALNYGIGITSKNKKTLFHEIWLQPLAAILILVILRLTQPI